MAKNLGIAKMDVELDAFVNLVTISSKAKKLMKNIVMECKNLLQDFEKYIVSFLLVLDNVDVLITHSIETWSYRCISSALPNEHSLASSQKLG
nr:hypothetical protein CFP56_35178 [Quercus suber]